MKKAMQLPNIRNNVKVEENMFDYKITFSSTLPMVQPYRGGSKQKEEIVRYDSNIYRAKAKILDYAKNNIFNYFLTITIDSKKFDLSNYETLRKKISKYFDNIKQQKDSSFKYILVAELGGKNKRLHFHGLIYLENKDLLKHIGRGLYRNEYLFKTFGANQFKPITEYNVSCALYCSKYIEKYNSCINMFNRYYFCSKGLKISKNITFIFDEKSLEDLFIYCCSCGLLSNGTYADTMVVSRDFIIQYLTLKNDFEKVLA